MANIGFVGLGHMGLPMAINLLKAGHCVTGYDIQATACAEFARVGGLVARHLAELALNQDVLITMLQTGQQVSHVCQGPDGLFNQCRSSTLYIDCSTIDVNSARTLHQQAQEQGLISVDAPVSGGVAGAQAATLTFMVGGSDKAYQHARPILSLMGQKIIHTGPSGSGLAAKICNNMILGVSMLGVCEAFNLAEQLGLSAAKLFEVVSNASGQCWSMSNYVPVAGILQQVPANNNFQPGFAAAMMLKDLLLSQDCARAVEVNTPMGAQSAALYQQFINEGNGHLDFSAIIQMLARMNEV